MGATPMRLFMCVLMTSFLCAQMTYIEPSKRDAIAYIIKQSISETIEYHSDVSKQNIYALSAPEPELAPVAEEVAYVEPAYVEPVYEEPAYVEPVYIEPVYIEPTVVPVKAVEPVVAKPVYEAPVVPHINNYLEGNWSEYADGVMDMVIDNRIKMGHVPANIRDIYGDRFIAVYWYEDALQEYTAVFPDGSHEVVFAIDWHDAYYEYIDNSFFLNNDVIGELHYGLARRHQVGELGRQGEIYKADWQQ